MSDKNISIISLSPSPKSLNSISSNKSDNKNDKILIDLNNNNKNYDSDIKDLIDNLGDNVINEINKSKKSIINLINKTLNSVSEITINLNVIDVESLLTKKKKTFSNDHYARNLLWSIYCQINYPDKKNANQVKYLEFYVRCKSDKSNLKIWSCKAHVELRLLSQFSTFEHKIKTFDYTFTEHDCDYGYGQFINYSDLINPIKGYIKGSSIVLQANIKVDEPIGLV